MTAERRLSPRAVTYEVESASGGVLSLGKLTAKVDKGSEKRDKRSDIPHPSSLIPHPFFSVRTPTAIVTDLGTEFGVEVSKEGQTTSHVFRGSVKLQLLAADARKPAAPSSCTRTRQSVRRKAAPAARPLPCAA